MGRIAKAYEVKFRTLLERARARRLDQGLKWLAGKARRLSANGAMSPADALTRVYEDLAAKLPARSNRPTPDPRRFFCDAGLGGLARWLRGAGYEAFWQPGIDDAVLLEEARQTSTTILTTDSIMMERRVLRDHILPALWLPPTLAVSEQLTMVFREFRLVALDPRCMSCGGELARTEKEPLRERIPPKTYRWLDEYFLCRRCGKLFWHGTHWERIQRQLGQAARHSGAEPGVTA